MTNVTTTLATGTALVLVETIAAEQTIPNRDYVAEIENTASKTCASILRHDAAIGKRAKDWGCDMLNAIKVHNFDSDFLIGATKKAADWKALIGKPGTKVKSVFNRWFSNLRSILEMWADLSPEVQTDLLGGTRSFLSVVETIQKAERDASKLAAAEQAATDKALATAPVLATDATATDATATDVSKVLRSMAAYIAGLSDADCMALATSDEIAALNDVILAAYDKGAALVAAMVAPATATGTEG